MLWQEKLNTYNPTIQKSYLYAFQCLSLQIFILCVYLYLCVNISSKITVDTFMLEQHYLLTFFSVIYRLSLSLNSFNIILLLSNNILRKCTFVYPIVYFGTFFFFLIELGFELRNLCLQSRRCTIWVMSLVHFTLVLWSICPSWTWTEILPISASQVARITLVPGSFSYFLCVLKILRTSNLLVIIFSWDFFKVRFFSLFYNYRNKWDLWQKLESIKNSNEITLNPTN
jgi:hypothetical protein